MRQSRYEKINPTLAASTFTVAFMAFIIGLKLDGYITVGWLWILSPLWGVIAIGLALLTVIAAFYIALALIFWAVRKAKGGL